MRERTRTYRAVMALSRPVALWGRLQVEGVECLPESGPLLVVGNHDSHWDPVMVGIGAVKRRQIRALAKAELWDVRGLGPVLNGMGQVPINRGSGDKEALARAIETLRAGACIGVFPEGTRSRGKVLRARSGVGRLALEVPEAHVTLVAIEGTSDLTGFPRRPRIRIRFFDPAGGQPRPDEDPGELSTRLLAELRALVPPRSPTASARSRRRDEGWAGRAWPLPFSANQPAAEGGESVAVGFARFPVGGVGVQRVAGVGDLFAAVAALDRAQLRGRGAVARLRRACGDQRRPDPGAAAVAGGVGAACRPRSRTSSRPFGVGENEAELGNAAKRDEGAGVGFRVGRHGLRRGGAGRGAATAAAACSAPPPQPPIGRAVASDQ